MVAAPNQNSKKRAQRPAMIRTSSEQPRARNGAVTAQPEAEPAEGFDSFRFARTAQRALQALWAVREPWALIERGQVRVANDSFHKLVNGAKGRRDWSSGDSTDDGSFHRRMSLDRLVLCEAERALEQGPDSPARFTSD